MNDTKQTEMETFFRDIMGVILEEGKTGMVTMLNPKFVSCNLQEKSLTLEFKVYEWMLNPEKILFGGIITSMLDNSYGFLGHYFAGDKFISTINMGTTFLKPGSLNDIIHVKVKADSVGKTILNMSGEVLNISSNKLMATSYTSFMVLNKTVKL